LVRRFPIIIKKLIEWFPDSSFYNNVDKDMSEATIAEVEPP
jgi:hypothetical protein